MTTRTTESEGKPERIRAEASDSDQGTTVDGRYLLEACVGVGGMGTVYRAHDKVIDRHVAIKRLHPSRLADQTHLFQREYHTLKHLAHPSIVGVYDYGVDRDQPYYTMELLDGCDVSSLAPIPWQQTCAILRDLASALSLVHARGFVHRDVSGRNLRLTNDGRAKLIDFGSMVPFGKPVKAVGTPPFIAPEALYRQPLDGRADLVALIAGDAANTDRYTALVRQQWPVDQHPALAARYEKLLEDARLTALGPSAVRRPAWSGGVTRGGECLLATDVRRQLRAHTDLDGRCRAALGMIMECTQSDSGYLFLACEGGSELKLRTTEASQPPPAALEAELECLLQRGIDGKRKPATTVLRIRPHTWPSAPWAKARWCRWC